MNLTFMELLRKGEKRPEDIGEFVKKFWAGDYPGPIHQYLGMTEQQYFDFKKEGA